MLQKMGISTIQSYQEFAKIFEAIGIDSDVINKYFKGTVSRIEGISLKDIQEDVETLHSKAFDPLGLLLIQRLTAMVHIS